eukprot:PhF_6_TR38699/c0_g1_i2/m.57907
MFWLTIISITSMMVLSKSNAPPPSELQALLDLYSSCGKHWDDPTNWGDTTRSVCSWTGIECSDEDMNVSGIHIFFQPMRKNKLHSCELPASLDQLQALKSFNYPGGVSGTFPSVFQRIQTLTKIDVANGDFYGTLPSWISSLTNLETLKVGNYNNGGLGDPLPNMQNISRLTDLN